MAEDVSERSEELGVLMLNVVNGDHEAGDIRRRKRRKRGRGRLAGGGTRGVEVRNRRLAVGGHGSSKS